MCIRDSSLGTRPDVPLKEARKKRDEARTLLESGVDPSSYRSSIKASAQNTFEAVAREWYEKYRGQWAPSRATKTLGRLEKDLLPCLGSRPITSIEPPELLQVLRRVESRGALETAHRIHQIASRVFRYGGATGRCLRDPTTDLRGALNPDRPLLEVRSIVRF